MGNRMERSLQGIGSRDDEDREIRGYNSWIFESEVFFSILLFLFLILIILFSTALEEFNLLHPPEEEYSSDEGFSSDEEGDVRRGAVDPDKAVRGTRKMLTDFKERYSLFCVDFFRKFKSFSGFRIGHGNYRWTITNNGLGNPQRVRNSELEQSGRLRPEIVFEQFLLSIPARI